MIATYGLYKIGLRYVAEYEAEWDEALKMDARLDRVEHLCRLISAAEDELYSLLAS